MTITAIEELYPRLTSEITGTVFGLENFHEMASIYGPKTLEMIHKFLFEKNILFNL